jgi:hypothetical protein
MEKFTTLYLTKMPESKEIQVIENLTNIEVSYVNFSSPAINVYTVQVLKLLEVKTLLASYGCFIDEQKENKYSPKFLSWCTSYKEEEKVLRELIEGRPADLKQLKQDFFELTGKQYRAKKGA